MPATYRADHIGSLLRPRELLDARASHAAGRISAAQLKELEDRCILQALELQRGCGVQVFSDGEYRRGDFRTELANALEGMDPWRCAPQLAGASAYGCCFGRGCCLAAGLGNWRTSAASTAHYGA